MTVKKLEIFIIATIIGVIGVVYALTQKQVLAPTSPEISETVQNQQGIAVGEPNPAMVIEYKGVDGRTALDLLKSSHRVDLKTYSFGDMVTGIDGVMADANHFWAMYVNGELSQVGASQYVTKPGETIKWQIDEIKF